MRKKNQHALENDTSEMDKQVDTAKARAERVLVRLIGNISRCCVMHASRTTRRFHLSMSQAIVLGELFRHNGCRQEDLREIVLLDKGNITRAVQQLEEYGLVQRKQDPADRRAVLVHVTRKALALEKEMAVIVSEWDDRLTTGFTHEERETLTTLLLRMEINAKAMGKE